MLPKDIRDLYDGFIFLQTTTGFFDTTSWKRLLRQYLVDQQITPWSKIIVLVVDGFKAHVCEAVEELYQVW